MAGYDSDSVAVVDVTAPAQPTVLGSIAGDTVNLHYPVEVAVSPDGTFLLATGYEGDSLAVLRFWQFFCAR